jgi:hypothetical protein
MLRILAIENDTMSLRSILSGRVHADLAIVKTVSDAVDRLSGEGPDVVLVPALLSPRDEIELMTAVKERGAPYLQVLNMPAIDVRVHPALLAGIVSNALRRAGDLRAKYDALDAHARWCAEFGLSPVEPLQSRGAAVQQPTENRRRAERMGRGCVPWISAVRMPWGLDVNLVNISNSGILLESGTKLPPGITYDLQLDAVEATVLVKARIIRAEVSRVDPRGVRYHLAATFEQHLDLTGPRRTPPVSMPQALTELMATVVADVMSQEPAEIRFARGLRKLVPARDVLVRRAPIAAVDGSESFYFHVSGKGSSRRILQVVLDPDRPLTATEFCVLKAAASMAAALQQLETCSVPAASRACVA